jgi:hypothetical protein
MSTTITANALTHFGLDESAYCFCWRIVPRQADALAQPTWGLPAGYGTPEGYTSLDRSLIIGGLEYSSTANVMPTSVPTSIGLEIDGVDATLLFPEQAQLQRERVELRIYDGALVKLFAIPWEAFLNGDADETDIARLLSGRLGEAQLDDHSATFEFLPISAVIENAKIGTITSDLCNCPRFGRGRCKNLVIGDGVDIKLHGRTVIGIIKAAPEGKTAHGMNLYVQLDQTRLDGWANFGVLRIAGGDLKGAEMAIKQFRQTGEITLRSPCPIVPPVGTPIEIEEGCDRTLTMCLTKEPNPSSPTGDGNILNFRGYRCPGQKKLVKQKTSKKPATSW